jgi:hypothetical protein
MKLLASNSKSWGFDPESTQINVVLFVSRNKDNESVPNFVERRKSFITSYSIGNDKLNQEFDDFANAGVPGEMSRFYYSVNERNLKAIYKELLHFLIDEPDFNLCALPGKLASIAAKKECALTHKWMFDFDCNDKDKVTEFCNDIVNIDADVHTDIHKTPNGYAVVTNRGFDTRELFKKWDKDVTLKKDDLLCVGWYFDINERVKMQS